MTFREIAAAPYDVLLARLEELDADPTLPETYEGEWDDLLIAALIVNVDNVNADL